MKVALITPAATGSRSGNRVTAVRWGAMLRRLGHRVSIAMDDTGEPADLMVAIHAWRSAGAAAAFKARQPAAPLIVLLSGTDIYRFQHTEPETTLATMRAADRLVGLHDRVHSDIPDAFADKLAIIHQSCRPPRAPRTPSRRWFQICVVGHLREEKDPLRAARAARLMAPSSRLRVVHLGGATTPDWAEAARAEEAANPRYRWRGPVPPWKVRQCYARSHAMVISSVMEGGANVVSEAIVSALPVIASDISGNRGLLGEDHEGYYRAGDEAELARVLERAEREPGFLDALAARAAAGAHRFDPDAELAGWERLLSGFGA